MVTEPLGLKRGEVVVVPYDPRWPILFEEAAAQLKATLGAAILAMHHVGSTAVPGLCAKPIIDILAASSAPITFRWRSLGRGTTGSRLRSVTRCVVILSLRRRTHASS